MLSVSCQRASPAVTACACFGNGAPTFQSASLSARPECTEAHKALRTVSCRAFASWNGAPTFQSASLSARPECTEAHKPLRTVRVVRLRVWNGAPTFQSASLSARPECAEAQSPLRTVRVVRLRLAGAATTNRCSAKPVWKPALREKDCCELWLKQVKFYVRMQMRARSLRPGT